VFPKSAWSGSREQFLHCGLRKFRHSMSSVYRWYQQLVCGWLVYDTHRTVDATRSRHGWVHMFITHCPTVTLQLHNFDLFRTCRTSSFCTVAWQLARFQLTRRIARSLGDSWASCFCIKSTAYFLTNLVCYFFKSRTSLSRNANLEGSLYQQADQWSRNSPVNLRTKKQLSVKWQ